ncbi:MAG: sugar transferase [Patescibacteria group bacterium]|nr:sugar transferase [Patescibacteria group bacterium]
MLKRLFDIIFSFLGIISTLPLLILITITIRIDSKGPIFYKGIRMGRFNKSFKILKFRTMFVNSEINGPPITIKNDTRITKVGRFLRKYKLDELPQFINVLKGEMSLVGPRPEIPLYFKYYTEEEEKIILSVRPGITDYGSIEFHDESKLLAGSKNPVEDYVKKIKDKKVKLQLQYIKNQCLWLDVKIILKTIKTIIYTRLYKKNI